MADAAQTFQCRVQTVDATVLSVEATSVIFPAEDGSAGVLARRGPLAATLGAGRLRVEKADGKAAEFFVAGGFAHVRGDVVTILAKECVPADKLSVGEAEEKLVEAQAMPKRPAAAAEAREAAEHAARARLRAARK